MRAYVLMFLTVVVALPGTTFAQSAVQLAARRDLLSAASQAGGAGDHVRALDLAQRAGQIQMTPSLRMFIAQQESALGRIAPAIGDADSCVREAERDTTMRSREAVLTDCRQLVTQLQSRAGHITAHLPSPLPAGLRVTLGGEPLDSALYGFPAVVTPGNVVVEAQASGRTTFHRSVAVNAGASVDVNIDLPVARNTSAEGTPAATSTSPAAASEQSAPRENHARAASSRGSASGSSGGGGIGGAAIASVVVAILGLGAVGVGVFFYVDTGHTYALCQVNGCLPASEPRGEELAGVVMMYGGGVLAVLGLAGFLLLRHRGAPEGNARATSFWLDPRGVAGITGTF